MSLPLPPLRFLIAASLAFPFLSIHAEEKPVETDSRLHADGKGWGLDKATVKDSARPRVLLIGDSILNGYRKEVIAAFEGKAYVDVWVNPYNQSEHLNKLLAEVLDQGPYDVVHFNMGLHGWQEGRIKPGTFEPLTKAYVEVIRRKLPKARILWASSTPVTKKGVPTELDPEIDPVIVDHNRRAATVMAELKVPVNDFYGLLAGQLPLARGDQFHWKAEAYQILAKMAIESVGGELAALPRRHDITKRASEIDPRAKEHPGIDFLFTGPDGKVRDLQHAVFDARVPSQGKLVIWLMDHNQGLFERISGYGLHGIQVHYANRWFSKIGKEALIDGTSLGKIRLEAATGEDHSPLVEIPAPDGLTERSFQFVKWLAKEHPEGQWAQFLNPEGNGLDWEKVILSGISHGSTTAARLAIHRKVDRVVMFSGPRDNTETWQAFPSVTPSNRYFGFTHVLDGGWTADHYCRSWQMLGLHQHGPVVDVDKTPGPYGNSRRLVTEADVKNDAGRAHNASVPGGAAVKDGAGLFIHEPVWHYLFNHPVDQTGTPVPLDPGCRMDQRK